MFEAWAATWYWERALIDMSERHVRELREALAQGISGTKLQKLRDTHSKEMRTLAPDPRAFG
jgi:hypothetical protein